MCIDDSGSAEQRKNRGSDATPPSFEEAVAEDIQSLKDCGVLGCGSFEEALDAFGSWMRRDGIPMSHGAHSWVGRGLYALQIGSWLRHFPRDQFLVVRLEEMSSVEGLDSVIARVFAHIGLPNYKLKQKERHNARAGMEIPEGVSSYLFNAAHNSLVGFDTGTPTTIRIVCPIQSMARGAVGS